MTKQLATVGTQRTVLAVTRNVVSTQRLLDVLPVFESDPRVQVLFTISHKDGRRSEFAADAQDLLHDLGARTISWDAATSTGFDLALCASYVGDLERLKAPVVVLPHGAGHNRFLPGSRSVPGMSRELLLRNGRPVARSVVLSGEEQLERLRQSCPEVADSAVVAGDPCFDRLLASEDFFDGYRISLGLNRGQRLILISSTWHDRSLLATWTDLAAGLVGTLPVDEFRVAMTVHPNVWSFHGGWQLAGWLAEARRAGLIVLPPDGSWRGALVAADLVIGDHGSVSLYAAALGKPLLLGAFGTEKVVPDSPAARLGQAAPRLVPEHDLRSQVIAGLAGGGYADVVAGMLTARGQALPRLRALCYGLLGLDPPPGAPFTAPVPGVHGDPPDVKAHRVRSRVDGRTVFLERFPAALSLGEPGDVITAWADEPDQTLRHHATVIIGSDAADLLRRYPGCRFAVAPAEGGCLVTSRDAAPVRLSGDADVAVLAAAHACMPRLTGRAEIQLGERTIVYFASR